MQFVTAYSESVRKGSKQAIKGPSMTEPDNAMSIPEIIARFTRGVGIPVQQRPWTTNDGTREDVEGFAEVEGSDIVVKEVEDPKPADPAPAPAPAEPKPADPAPAPAGA